MSELSYKKDLDMQEKYYFIVYHFTRWNTDGWPSVCQGMTQKHPIQWQIETNEKYDDGNYLIVFWSEISKEIYEIYNEQIG